MRKAVSHDPLPGDRDAPAGWCVDGHDDFLIIDQDQRGTGYLGRAYIYFGGPGLDAQPDLVLQQNASGAISTVLTGPFEFNGDKLFSQRMSLVK